MSDIPVIIAAAGMGKRLGLGMPKCLVPVNGVPILDYQLDLLKDVKDIRLVVGFQADKVIAFAKSKRPGITIFRNDEFANTATLHSLAKAAQNIDASCLCLDGDMLVDAASFRTFLQYCSTGTPHMAISDDIGEDPVYAAAQQASATEPLFRVNGFSRTEASAYEWANIVFCPAAWLKKSAHWGKATVFSLLETYLPLTALPVRRLEVDTPEDLRRAEHEVIHNPAWKSLRSFRP